MKKYSEADLADKITLNSLFQLMSLMDNLKKFIGQGILKEVDGNFSVNDFNNKNDLPSIVEITFESYPSKKTYKLEADTERGGIFWKAD